ncbi:glycine--tRNA ligase subunit beta, partial [Buchnera aphidicola (Hormaphis cornu)]
KNDRININHAKEYPLILLKEGNVICDYSYRKKQIKEKIHQAAIKIKGMLIPNKKLLHEITALVEWPTILIGRFKKDFLSLPQSSIIYILENIQKCFPVYTSSEKLMPYFIFVSNIKPKNLSNIIQGNEQVINSRLSDAQFFYTIDRKQPLENYHIQLKKIIFYNQLGSMYEKTLRLKSLMIWFANKINLNLKKSIRAALLCKCDLITYMVSEFPDIQGYIGMEYALSDGEDPEIANAIREHYYPAFSKDRLPNNPIACALSIADKIDTIIGMLLSDNYPKKNKDPFSLRRLSLSILKILIKKRIEIDLLELIQQSIILYKNHKVKNSTINNINNFFINRSIAFYKQQGLDPNIIQSVLALNITRPIDIEHRISVISNLKHSDDLRLLISTNKRIINILEKSKFFKNKAIKKNLMTSDIEQKLYTETNELNLFIQSNVSIKNYQKILHKAIKLCIPINYFFNNIIIKDQNPEIHFNRLSLLQYIKESFFKIADFSYLHSF